MKFRAKLNGATIEAFQLTTEPRPYNDDWPQWANEAWHKRRGQIGAIYHDRGRGGPLCILTLAQGEMRVALNDWIIRDDKGQLYPCKPRAFEATYEPVE